MATVLFPLKIIASDTPLQASCSDGTIKQMVSCYAKKEGVNPELAQYIVSNESHYNPSVVGDLHVKCPSTGKPVEARGLVQITSCYHPEISDSQAFDPNFSLEFGMKLMKDKKSCMSQFSTCRKYYESKES